MRLTFQKGINENIDVFWKNKHNLIKVAELSQTIDHPPTSTKGHYVCLTKHYLISDELRQIANKLDLLNNEGNKMSKFFVENPTLTRVREFGADSPDGERIVEVLVNVEKGKLNVKLRELQRVAAEAVAEFLDSNEG